MDRVVFARSNRSKGPCTLSRLLDVQGSYRLQATGRADEA
jgi:hypothetical protein